MARVIDCSDLAGAYAARLFAETGHEVIRVEHLSDNLVRRLPPFLDNAIEGENSAYHHFLNAGKRSLALDLKSIADQEVFYRLIASSNVLISGPSQSIDETRVVASNRKLVWCKIDDDEPDICAMARSGLMSLTGQPDAAPMVLGGDLAVLATGIYVALATAAALRQAAQSGEGSIVTVSLREALESFVEQAMVEYSFSGIVTERRGSKGAITAISGAMPCQDGHWVISQIHRPGRWSKFVEWVKDPELAADPSLAEEENQIKRRDFILDHVLRWAGQFSKQELVEQAQERHFPASPVSTMLDLIDDPQLTARGFLTEIEHRQFGKIMFPQGALASLRRAKLSPAPTLGEHNSEILAQLGYSPTDRQAFAAAKVVEP